MIRSLFVIAVLCTTAAYSQTTWSGEIGGGPVKLIGGSSGDWGVGFAFSGALSIQADPAYSIAFIAERATCPYVNDSTGLGYRYVSGGALTISAISANIRFPLLTGVVSPYLGFGLGYSWMLMDSLYGHNDTWDRPGVWAGVPNNAGSVRAAIGVRVSVCERFGVGTELHLTTSESKFGMIPLRLFASGVF